MPFVFSHVEYCDMHFVCGFYDGNARAAVEEYQRRFPIKGFRLEVYLREFTRHCLILVLFRVLLCSLKGRWYERLSHERTFFRCFREVRVSPPVEGPLASAYHVCRFGEINMWRICILTLIKVTTSGNRRPWSAYGFVPLDNSTYRTVKLHVIQWWSVF